ncbi:MAG: Gfo/Idh/MocA family oxidoreductase [Pacificimonas sp.]
MPEAAFRWGIVGYGWVARDYMVPGIADAGGDLIAVADVSADARRAAEVAGARSYADPSTMIEENRLDAVYIATPNHLHAEAVEVCAAHNISVLCEKPLAADLSGVERIATAAAGGTLIAAAFDQRHHPAHQVIREAVAMGRIGTPTVIRIVYCCWVDPTWTRGTGDNWRALHGCAGGGAVLDLAPHGLDLAEYLTGESVDALSMVFQRRIHDYDVEDGGVVTGRTESGILFSAHATYSWPENLPRRRLEVAGDSGMIVASDTMGQDAGGHVTWLGADGGQEELDFDRDATPFARQAAAFQKQARGRGDQFDFDRDLAAARRFFAAYTAAGKDLPPCR